MRDNTTTNTADVKQHIQILLQQNDYKTASGNCGMWHIGATISATRLLGDGDLSAPAFRGGMKGASSTSAGLGRQSNLHGRMKLITTAVGNPVKLRMECVLHSEQRLRHTPRAAEKSAVEWSETDFESISTPAVCVRRLWTVEKTAKNPSSITLWRLVTFLLLGAMYKLILLLLLLLYIYQCDLSVGDQIMSRRETNTQPCTLCMVCHSVELTLLPLQCNTARRIPSPAIHARYK